MEIDQIIMGILAFVLMILLVMYFTVVPVCDRSTRDITATQLKECLSE